MTTADLESQSMVNKLYRAFFSPGKYEVKSADQAVLERGQTSRIGPQGSRLAVTTWGDSGPAALLVHGWGGSRAQMTGFVDPLLRAGYRVAAFDQPAHGESDGTITNLLEIAPSMNVMVEQQGSVEAIIAHSFGTLVTSYALVQLDVPLPRRLVYLGALNRLMDSVPRFQVLAGISDPLARALRDRIYAEFGQAKLEAIRNELLAPQIHVPALMIHDTRDSVTPLEDSRAIARAWKTARLLETEGLGHRGTLQSAAVQSQVLEFLQA